MAISKREAHPIPETSSNTFIYNQQWTATTYILVFLLIIASFLSGSLYTKVTYLEKNGVLGTTTTAVQAEVTPTVAPVTLEMVKDVFDKSQIKFGDSIEVADPSCPYCHVAGGYDGELNKQVGSQFTLVSDGGTYVAPMPEIEDLVKNNKASFAYIYFPGHGNGEMGTKAMYCAFDEGKFWEVHNKLMGYEGYNLMNNTIQNDKSKSKELADFLSDVIDPSAIQKCLDSGKYDNRLSDDMNLANTLQVNGTPGFYINETKFGGAYSYKDMESAVSSALQ